MTATKQQELETLNKIREMVKELGENSYIGTAFEGCFELAERNIEEDAAYSMGAYSAYLAKSEAVKEINKKDEEIKRLQKLLEEEQEWKPYTDPHNVTEEQYKKLAESDYVRVLSDDEAKEKLYQLFGFAPEKVNIIHTVSIYEVNRHHRLRRVGKYERKALYDVSDMNYIRFNCGCVMYELYNGELKFFID